MVLDRDLRRAGLVVPQPEFRQIDTVPLLHRGNEILDRRGIIVVRRDIHIHAAAEALRAEQGVQHADDLRALVVDGRCVEIVDAQIALRLHRMGERAGILGKLDRAQRADIADAGHRGAALIGGEQLIAEDGEPLLQRQLKPVAAGDAVAGPIVEILMRDDGFDPLVIGVGRGVGLGQHIARVEDVEPLILHRAHVEIADRDDVEDVEIVFEAEGLLVPAHRFFERCHRVAAFVLVAAAHPNRQRHIAAGARRERVAHRDEIAGDEREEV